ncbi:PREDICTED: uncharacterized protein LOC109211708 [Nicotiana attenuata]|uniref:uncharacterized protein LOC109211708 n=1 Tax=Nicotiana attenuata TaxID=49451 RepID=UPI0009049909|nr:PREDICTED: uncharacterized protein LOC109211708 [Nicotiana attenuata]
MAHFLGSCMISWGTRKQNSVALSTTEAEYVAAASCCAQLLWIKQQLEDFGMFFECVPLLCDNASVLKMAKNPVQHKRTKHIDVRNHFLRDNVEKGLICMKFCSTEDQSKQAANVLYFSLKGEAYTCKNSSGNPVLLTQGTPNTPSITPTESLPVIALITLIIEPSPTTTSPNPKAETPPPSISSPTQSSTGSHWIRKTSTSKTFVATNSPPASSAKMGETDMVED